MRTIFLALGISAFVVSPAAAQTENGLCHHAGLIYSPGSMISLGRTLLKCSASGNEAGRWVLATSDDIAVESANCVSGGREFGQGAVQSSGAIDLKCSKGVWYIQEP